MSNDSVLSCDAKSKDEFDIQVRWVIPQKLDSMTFIGRDVLTVAHDIYIIFLNLKARTELVYVANNEKDGDGVDVVAGHKANIFAFAEKIKHPRIFVVSYPHFQVITKLQDMMVNRYKALCMMECDLIAGFSGFPNYVLTIWNWRTSQHLLNVPTNVVQRSQIYMASRTHMLIAQCWGIGLNVWEVAHCYKKCFMSKRSKAEVSEWEIFDPIFVGLCWTLEGQLYSIDADANLYSLLSDGINMVSNMEWSEDRKGDVKPCICSFQNGIIIYGPDNCLRSLKKCDTKWKAVWTYTPLDTIVRLLSNSTCDVAAMWTARGQVYRITGDSEEHIRVELFAYKQRNITNIKFIAPDYTHLATIDDSSVLCIYEVLSCKLVCMKYIQGANVSFEASPVEPVLIIYGEVGQNYGLALYTYSASGGLQKVAKMCLTHQIVSRVVFSPTGREVVAAAMSAGHIFIISLSQDHKLNLVRYTELGRGLADCLMMKVGDAMRSFNLLLFSDKYTIGERVACINAETGKDNKFAGKMMGPYLRLLPLSTKDTMLAIPHLSKQYHILKLSGDKGTAVSVRIESVVDSGHDIKHFDGFFTPDALITFGYCGTVIKRQSHGPKQYDFKTSVSHRYEKGILQAVLDLNKKYMAHLGGNRTAALRLLTKHHELVELCHEPLGQELFDEAINSIDIIDESDKNYLDIQEERKVREEAMDYKKQRNEVVACFESIQQKLVQLLEDNLNRPPLHQLSLSEFNLHMEHKKERLKQAEREREEIRLRTEARIRAQDKVTAWIKSKCWDTMLTPRTKLFAIFSHYQVENYAVLPTQRENWPELEQVEALRCIEMENDADLFKPWEEKHFEPEARTSVQTKNGPPSLTSTQQFKSHHSQSIQESVVEAEETPESEQHVLSASLAHNFVSIPPFMITQMYAFSFLQMNWLSQIVKLNVQNMRLWFNKHFDDLMYQKKREVGLVEERNARLRFILDELNKLSDLRGSFHHLSMQIIDPKWRQEEQPEKLIKVEPEECSIAPYISPSQIVIVPPDPGPKDDFRERALVEMMDGVLEKLWHEEIKKPIPMPQCMLDKNPEQFNEDDLRVVFEYEAKVQFRNEERDRYRKMLHAEYAKLSQVLNEGVVKFNQKVKETWLLKLKVDSIIGQENLNLMRLRRVNLDRVEMAEKLEVMREQKKRDEDEIEILQMEHKAITEQSEECQASYESYAQKDRYMERMFKNHFADLSPIIVDQCYKFYKKRPKWHQRATMTPVVLYDLAHAVATGERPPMLHLDCLEYFKGVEQLDLISNMPPVMDEGLWTTMCKLRRQKIENEIRMRGIVQETAYIDSASNVWSKAIQARRNVLLRLNEQIVQHREQVEHTARNKTIQLVLPAGQVEILTSGHMEDFEDAVLMKREDIEVINNIILKVGEMKLRMMRKQMDFRKGILAKEWEHAQVKMKLKHMEQELYSYQRLKIPKELQLYLKNKELGCTDEMEYVRMEKEMEASKVSVNKILNEQIHRVEELELKIGKVEASEQRLNKLISNLNVKVSEKRINEDPLESIRIRRVLKLRMQTLVERSKLIREVQNNHTNIVLLQTELELLRLKTYPTLASFRTLDNA